MNDEVLDHVRRGIKLIKIWGKQDSHEYYKTIKKQGNAKNNNWEILEICLATFTFLRKYVNESMKGVCYNFNAKNIFQWYFPKFLERNWVKTFPIDGVPYDSHLNI